MRAKAKWRKVVSLHGWNFETIGIDINNLLCRRRRMRLASRNALCKSTITCSTAAVSICYRLAILLIVFFFVLCLTFMYRRPVLWSHALTKYKTIKTRSLAESKAIYLPGNWRQQEITNRKLKTTHAAFSAMIYSTLSVAQN